MNPVLRRRGLLSLAAAGSLALTGCNGTAVEQAERSGEPARPSGAPSVDASKFALGSAVIGLTYIPNIQFAPFYLAADKGMFTSQGVTATLRHHGASEGLFTALTAGKEHFVLAGGDEVVQANAQGADLVTVAAFYQDYPIVLIVREESPIKTLADLKGHSIGLPGEYGESWFGLQLALRNAQLTKTDVKIVSIGYTQQAALSTGKVDAIVGFANNDAVQFATNKVQVRTIPIGDDVPLVSSSIVTTRKQLETEPELTKAVCRAITDGIKAVVADPKAAIDISVTHVPGLKQPAMRTGALATLEASIPLWKGKEAEPTGRLDAARFEAMADFMHEAGLVPTKVDGAKSVDTSVMG